MPDHNGLVASRKHTLQAAWSGGTLPPYCFISAAFHIGASLLICLSSSYSIAGDSPCFPSPSHTSTHPADIALEQAQNHYQEALKSVDNTVLREQALSLTSEALDLARMDRRYVPDFSTYTRLESIHNLAFGLGDQKQFDRVIGKYISRLKKRFHPNYHLILDLEIIHARGRYYSGDVKGASIFQRKTLKAMSHLCNTETYQFLKLDYALSLWKLGRYGESLKYQNEVYTFQSKLDQADCTLVQRAHMELSATHLSLGNFQSADSLQSHLVKRITESTPNDPSVLAAKLALAKTKIKLHDYQGAITLRNQVLEAYVASNNSAFTTTRENLRNYGTPADSVFSYVLKNNMALLYYQLGELSQALEIQESAFIVVSRLLPDGDPQLQVFRTNLALMKYWTGDLDEAIRIQKYACDVYDKTSSKSAVEAQRGNLFLADMYYDRGEYSSALQLQQQVLRNCTSIVPSPSGSTDIIFKNWEVKAPESYTITVVTDPRTGGTSTSVTSTQARTSREIRDITLVHMQDLLDFNTAMVQLNIARTQFAMGRRLSAIKIQASVDKSLDASRSIVNRDAVQVKKRLARNWLIMGHLERAKAREMEVYHAESNDSDIPIMTFVGTCIDLAVIYDECGEFGKAVALFSTAYERLQEAVPESHPEMQRLKSGLAKANTHLGNLDAAAKLYSEVLHAQSSTLADDHPDYLNTLLNMSVLKREVGDVCGAIDLQQQVLKNRVSRLSVRHFETINVMRELAISKAALGDIDGAIVFQEQVYQAMRATYPDDDLDLQLMRSELGWSQFLAGDAVEAAKNLASAERRMKSLVTNDSPVLQEARMRRAVVLASIGKLKEAINIEAEVHRCLERSLPNEAPALIQTRLHLAACMAAVGRKRECHDLLKAAASGIREQSRIRSRILSPSADDRANAGLDTDRLISALLILSAGADSLEREALDAILTTRGLAERQARWRKCARSFVFRDSSMLDAIGKIAELKSAYYKAYASRSEALAEMWTQIERAEEIVARKVDSLPELRQTDRVHDYAYFQNVIQHGNAACITQSYLDINPLKRDFWLGGASRRIVAFVLTAGDEPRRIELGTSGGVSRDADLFRGELAGNGGAYTRGVTTADLDPDQGSASSRMREVLGGITEWSGTDIKTLWVSPDGPLALIPWEAVPIDSGRMIGDVVDIQYVEDVGCIRGAQSPAATPVLLAVGGIDYMERADASPSTDQRSGLFSQNAVRGGDGKWTPLPSSGGEVEAVTLLFKDNHPDGAITLLKGRNATREAFQQEAPNSSFIHIATHGYVEGRGSEALVMGLDACQSGEGDRSAKSRIVFAGANQDEQGHQGSITASEVAEMNLDKCELAVLSACETNMGPRYLGEATAGLNRALLLAGVKHTITSLWKVQDEGTGVFFRAFYTSLWNEGRTVPEAFRAAREHVRDLGYGRAVSTAFVLYSSCGNDH